MSFDLYLVCFADGQPSGVLRERIQAAFGDSVRWEEPVSGRTVYSEHDGCTIDLSPLEFDPDVISCISVNRPVRDHRFWESIHRIMRLGHVALIFPGGTGPLIADARAADHLPADMVESLGEPIRVSSGPETLAQIEAS